MDTPEEKLLINYESDGEQKTVWILNAGRHAVQNHEDPTQYRLPIYGIIPPDYLQQILSGDHLSGELTRGRITTDVSPLQDVLGILEESRALLSALQQQLQPANEHHITIATLFRGAVATQVASIIDQFGSDNPGFEEYRVSEIE